MVLFMIFPMHFGQDQSMGLSLTKSLGRQSGFFHHDFASVIMIACSLAKHFRLPYITEGLQFSIASHDKSVAASRQSPKDTELTSRWKTSKPTSM
jgi:hypothetical protein